MHSPEFVLVPIRRCSLTVAFAALLTLASCSRSDFSDEVLPDGGSTSDLQCVNDNDCIVTPFVAQISDTTQCYSTCCPSSYLALTTTAAQRNQELWNAYCSARYSTCSQTCNGPSNQAVCANGLCNP
jgi:hypothetical protein